MASRTAAVRSPIRLSAYMLRQTLIREQSYQEVSRPSHGCIPPQCLCLSRCHPTGSTGCAPVATSSGKYVPVERWSHDVCIGEEVQSGCVYRTGCPPLMCAPVGISSAGFLGCAGLLSVFLAGQDSTWRSPGASPRTHGERRWSDGSRSRRELCIKNERNPEQTTVLTVR